MYYGPDASYTWPADDVGHDDYRLWQGRYWPAATLAAMGVMTDGAVQRAGA